MKLQNFQNIFKNSTKIFVRLKCVFLLCLYNRENFWFNFVFNLKKKKRKEMSYNDVPL